MNIECRIVIVKQDVEIVRWNKYHRRKRYNN